MQQLIGLKAFGGSVLRRAIVFAAFATVFAGMGITYAAIVATDLAPTPGDENIALGFNTFVSDSGTELVNADLVFSTATLSAAGTSPPGVEATPGMPAIRNALTRGNYAYTFQVRETGNTTWQIGADIRIRLFSDDGTTSKLEATLYAQQAVKDDAAIDGVTVTVDLGSSTSVPIRYDIFVDRQ